MSTSFDGLGAVLPPPMTHILPLTLSPRVSPVGRGMLTMVLIESQPGLYTKGVSVIGDRPAVGSAGATTGVDEGADGRSRYIAAAQQAGTAAFCTQAAVPGSELPDLVDRQSLQGC